MNSERLKQLFTFLKDEPKDPFILYAIATEYNGNEPQEALKYFEILLEDHPDYLATYYHAANLFVDFDQAERAEATFKKGLELAIKQGNSLAHRELQNAYNQFLFEE
ncbi:MAG: tetratricopeptide repeat protein [Bacteroidota bacterium]